MRSSSRRFMTVTAFCLASVVNPGYFAGCTNGTDAGSEKFDFGEAEMLALVDEANATSPFDFTSGPDRYRLEISFAQRSGEDRDDTTAVLQRPLLASRAFACGTRTFMQSASACITRSEALLAATINLYRVDDNGMTLVVENRTVDASMWIHGTKLMNAQIVSGSYGIGSTTTQLSLSSSDAKTFELEQFSIVDSGLWVEADKK